MSKKRITYDELLPVVLELINLHCEIISSSGAKTEAEREFLAMGAQGLRDLVQNGSPETRRVASLRYFEKDLLQGWNESNDRDAERFWAEVRKRGLHYERQRQDVLALVLKRKRIKDEHEFDYVTDNIVIAEQEGRITHEQAVELDAMLMNFQGI